MVMFNGELGPCAGCGFSHYEIEVSIGTKLSIFEGSVVDKSGADNITDLVCSSCGEIKVQSGTMSGEDTARLFWEVEREVLET